MVDPGSPRFLTTRWSLILAAGEASTPESRAALDELCQAYWYPLYAFARRQGQDAEAAQDLVQGFFAQLLEKEALQAANPERGRFRSFLLTSFVNFRRNERAREQALKRGGGQPRVSLDGDAEGRFRLDPSHDETPEKQFLRDWALSLLERVLARLRESYVERRQEQVFDALKGTLTARDAKPYAELATELSISESAVKVAVHRLRGRYRETLKAEIAETVDGEKAVQDEVQALFSALSR